MENNLKIEGYELLNQKVYRVLKEAIIKGFLEPGTKLLENKIAEKMQVSRTPVREAMQKLVRCKGSFTNSRSIRRVSCSYCC